MLKIYVFTVKKIACGFLSRWLLSSLAPPAPAKPGMRAGRGAEDFGGPCSQPGRGRCNQDGQHVSVLSPQLRRAPWRSCRPPGTPVWLPTRCRNLAREPPPSLPGACPEQVPLTEALSPFPGHHVIIHLYHNGHVIDSKETKSITGSNPVWNTPFLFNLPAGDIQQQELSLEFTVVQVSRTEAITAKKVAWISHAQEPLLQPGVSAPARGRGTGRPGGASSCCPQEVAGVGLVFLGQRVFLALLEGHQPCPTPLLPLSCHRLASTPAAPRWATYGWVPTPPGSGCCTGRRCAAGASWSRRGGTGSSPTLSDPDLARSPRAGLVRDSAAHGNE